MKQRRRIITGILTTALVLSLVLFPSNAKAVTQAEINALKTQSGELNNQIDALQAQIDDLNAKESKTLAQKALYDEQCALLTQQILVIEEEIAGYETLIAEAQSEYDAAKAAEETQFEAMCTRIRAMEERGSVSYWEILFGASSFDDLLSRLDFIHEIIESDELVIAKYQTAQQETSERMAQLTELKEASESAKATLVLAQTELEAKLNEAISLIVAIQNDQASKEAYLAQLAAEEAALDAEIANAEEEYAKQVADAGGYAGPIDVTLIWPCSSRAITSYFGYRTAGSTNGVGSTNHKGIDIGNVGYTTPIVAVADGVVSVSTYSGSAGNYVTINHGNGVFSIYMHMSSRSVSSGQTVSQGQQIGVSGSSGNSTGPHLHFGLTANGTYVDPLLYLP